MKEQFPLADRRAVDVIKKRGRRGMGEIAQELSGKVERQAGALEPGNRETNANGFSAEKPFGQS
jgi:hypothetical protein